jgi:hypothetical protein
MSTGYLTLPLARLKIFDEDVEGDRRHEERACGHDCEIHQFAAEPDGERGDAAILSALRRELHDAEQVKDKGRENSADDKGGMNEESRNLELQEAGGNQENGREQKKETDEGDRAIIFHEVLWLLCHTKYAGRLGRQ